MKLAVSCLILVCGVACFGYECPPNVCDNVNCSQGMQTAKCEGWLEPKSSRCGCCPTCYKSVPLYGDCDMHHEPLSIYTEIRRLCPLLSYCRKGKCYRIPI